MTANSSANWLVSIVVPVELSASPRRETGAGFVFVGAPLECFTSLALWHGLLH